ncbi:peptidoglycan DD-metalloendopeptidase family protein [Novosphingobium flavum]|uniref:Peptidoglycan DD-metalloendopeptidase family protein n=1 Tax=Novosphingobium flavum TaxID=1778672 RepID=A0A7X1FPE6_9SPHN|nr:peptidoglycan DD-metalloendopeptidase family protein [Novosphingobium flavum]MBC2664505.1 peptidoglycan DD-metalloendopeptidase family protein [Novosphingobium flavum]
MRRAPALALAVLAATGALALGWSALGSAQEEAALTSAGDARRALSEARSQGDAARTRAEQLELQAAAAGAAAEKSAAEAAAAAARIQQAEAAIAARRAAILLIDRQQDAIAARIAARQQPLLRLTAGLQRLARRPLLLTLFRPGSVRDTMHVRAVMATILPEVARRTRGLRGELDRARLLRAAAEREVTALSAETADLGQRRAALAETETRQRLAARQSAGVADREAERALALAEQARDLGALADRLGEAGKLRDQLAALPGPVMRPAVPGAAALPVLPPEPPVLAAHPRPAFVLPVQGRIVAGFGEAQQGMQTPETLNGAPRSRGVSIAAGPGAQAVAAAPGRIAFAGPYRGYGQIVIVDHGQGWTSLVTGLAVLGVSVGDTVVAGSPLGTAGQGRPVVNFELRQDGQPVNPLDFAKF